jgi:glycosyltransferase involved in cell wall biosynthesis
MPAPPDPPTGPPLRVLSLIDSLEQGGAERSLIDMARLLRRHEIETTLAILRAHEHGFRGLASRSRLRVEVLGTRRAAAVRRLQDLLSAGGFDLVHTTLFESNLVGRVAGRLAKVPVLTSLVNVTYDPIRFSDPRVSSLKLRAARIVDGWTARHLNTRFHALTQAVADRAVADLGIDPGSISVIPRGRDPNEFHPPASPEERAAIRSELGLSPEAIAYVNVGRHEFQKGQRYLIEAMVPVLRSLPDAVLLVLGREGNETPTLLRQVSRLDLQSKVRFLGDRRDVGRILRGADSFVFPSIYEGLGGAMIEAMATGLPIVASDLPPIREVLGDCGVLVPPSDTSALAAALVEVGSNPDDAHQAGYQAMARFRSHYQLGHVVSRMAGLLRETADSGKRSVGRHRSSRSPIERSHDLM